MKKTIQSLLFLMGMAVAIPQVVTAQSVLSGVLSKVKSSSSSSTASAVSSLITSLLGTTEVTASSIKGTWSYTGPAIVLESESTLTELAGTLATSQVESKVSESLESLGISEGDIVITFDGDDGYECSFSGKSMSGTYELEDSTIKLKKSKVTAVKANIALNSSTELQLSVDADKILSLVSSLGSLASSNSTVSTLVSLLENYDGVQLGLVFKKQ